jgi:uracil-DNA glycosylase family 4
MPISAKESLNKLSKEISGCKKCTDLARLRKYPPVPGTGTAKARIIIVFNYPVISSTEGKITPNSNTDQYSFIKKILSKSGLSLTRDTYITHLVKCTPVGSLKDNDNIVIKPIEPLKKHINNCISFLNSEISIITPHIIVALGLDVSNVILQRFFSVEKKYRNMEKLHMRIFENPSFKMVPFHDTREVLINKTIKEDKYINDFESLARFLKKV